MTLKIISALLGFALLQSVQPKVQIDVPPMSEEYGELVYTYCDQGCWDVQADLKNPDPFGQKPHRKTHVTCADRTRFLMTSEDGVKHCIALQ